MVNGWFLKAGKIITYQIEFPFLAVQGGDGDGDDDDDVILSDHDPDKDEADPEANPLMVPLDDGEGPTQEEITNRWFDQDIFAEAVEQGDLGSMTMK